jgi:flagellar hook protein FlgE
MSILRAMYSGTSGLNAEGQALGVVGDNVANTNTVGFKQSRAIFEDVLGGAVGTKSPGAGVRMTRAQQIFAQGTLLNTGQATDLALSGDGFFVVHGTVGGITGNFYTRAGQMSLREDGTLVNQQGLPLQGYAALPNGQFAAGMSSIQVPTGEIPPRATTAFQVQANMDATSQTPALAWDPQNPAATSNFSTSVRVYDSLGNPHQVDVYFRKTGANAWEWHALAAGGEVQGGVQGQNFEFATGSLQFTNTGALNQSTLLSGGTVSFIGAAPNQAISFDFGTAIANGGTGLDGITQFGSPSNVSAQKQDGYASGALSGLKVDGDGVVRGIYTNGEQLPVAKLAIAKFRSNDGLGRAGQNLWTQTRESGEPAIGAAGSGGRAAVVSGALEQSNVDIAAQFVNLISHQRAFQANSKTITTADEMLQELMNIKR